VNDVAKPKGENVNAVEIVTGPKPSETFTAETFIEYMRKSSTVWWDSDGDDCSWVFRGQSDESWGLVPAAGRKRHALNRDFLAVMDALDEYAGEEIEDWSGLDQSKKGQILRYWAYWNGLERFINLAGNLSFKIVDPPKTSKIMEAVRGYVSGDWNFHMFRATVEYHNGQVPYKGVEAASIAQHHGIPTFLLDWTENPITACHFAATDTDPESGTDLAVWALNAGLVDGGTVKKLRNIVSKRINGSIAIYRPPKSENKYLASQSGVFTTFNFPSITWSADYPCLVEVLDQLKIGDLMKDADRFSDPEATRQVIHNFDTAGAPILRKVILPASQIKELQLILYREGISKAHLMPTLDNVAETSMNFLVAKHWR